MSEQQVWERQEVLRQAEQALNELAIEESYAQSNGALVSSGDYMRSPEGRAVEALRAEVKAAQDTVGGVVYRVPAENLGALREDLDKLVKRANKLGLGEISYRVSDDILRTEHKPVDPLIAMAELGYIPRYPKAYRFLVLNAGVVKLAGWMLLATLTVEPGGVMISRVPAFARAWALHREGATSEAPHRDAQDDTAVAAAQNTLDKINLTEYRDEKRATLCDHCGLSRRRTKTYLVEHVETGKIKQVGSNCLRDFLGVDPHALVKYATFLADIDAAASDEERYTGSGRQAVYTVEYLTHVCTILRTEGWVSRSEAGHSPATADRAWGNFYDYGKKDANGRPCFTEITEEDATRAAAAIEWAKEHLGAKVHQTQDASDFDHNLYVAANGETMPKKGDGVVAYLPVAHARFEEREIERKLRAEKVQEAGAASTHVGQVKDRLTITGTVASVYEKDGDWGTTFITKIEGDDGNIYKWFGSYDLGRGNKITGKFTVKKHDEYNGVKETVVTRPSGIEVTEVDGEPVPFRTGDEVRSRVGRAGKVVEVYPQTKSMLVTFEDNAGEQELLTFDQATAVTEDEGLQVPASYR